MPKFFFCKIKKCPIASRSVNSIINKNKKRELVLNFVGTIQPNPIQLFTHSMSVFSNSTKKYK